MQYQKDELRNAILGEAEKEFFDKGFKVASLRQIAKRAGTTIGNLYHYFENKEALFEALVRDEYEGFYGLIGNHENLKAPDVPWETLSISDWRDILTGFIGYMLPAFTRRFYILLNCSEGTCYEGTREYFIQFLNEHFTEHLDEMESNCPRELGKVISEQLLNGVLSIIRDYEDAGKKKQLMTELFLYFFLGLMGLMLH